jgi:hypothetical protein
VADSSFEALVTRHEPAVMRVCRRVLNQGKDAVEEKLAHEHIYCDQATVPVHDCERRLFELVDRVLVENAKAIRPGRWREGYVNTLPLTFIETQTSSVSEAAFCARELRLCDLTR